MIHQDLKPDLLLQHEILQLQWEGNAPGDALLGAVESAIRGGDAEQAWALLAPLQKDWSGRRAAYAARLQQAAGEPVDAFLPDETLKDRLYGAWLGRCAGCLLGKPVEGWHHDRIKAYLTHAGEYPLRAYFPKLEPYPEGLALHKNAETTTRGHIRGMVRDDDIDYTILGLLILEEAGAGFTTEDVAAAWMKRLPAYSIFTAEVVAYRNLLNGMSALQAAGYRNPYRDWIGAQIRADMWGYVNPGSPARAAAMALRDACLSHTTDGVYGGVWAAACIAGAFRASSVEDVITTGLEFIPQDSRLAAAVTDTLHWCAASRGDWEEAWRNIDGKYGHLPAVHVLHNTCVIVMGLVLGAGDFQKSICTGVMGGWDTDCTAATIGSITGAMPGAGGLPPDWTGPLDDRCASALAGVSECRISDLAERTLQCVVR